MLYIPHRNKFLINLSFPLFAFQTGAYCTDVEWLIDFAERSGPLTHLWRGINSSRDFSGCPACRNNLTLWCVKRTDTQINIFKGKEVRVTWNFMLVLYMGMVKLPTYALGYTGQTAGCWTLGWSKSSFLASEMKLLQAYDSFELMPKAFSSLNLGCWKSICNIFKVPGIWIVTLLSLIWT